MRTSSGSPRHCLHSGVGAQKSVAECWQPCASKRMALGECGSWYIASAPSESSYTGGAAAAMTASAPRVAGCIERCKFSRDYKLLNLGWVASASSRGASACSERACGRRQKPERAAEGQR